MAIKKSKKSIIKKDKVLLVDGRNLFYISYLGSISNNDLRDKNLNGIYIFFLKIKNILENNNYSDIFFIFDGKNSGLLKRSINPLYKKNRGENLIKTSFEYGYKDTSHFYNQENNLKNLLIKMNYNVICENIVEADDVIAYYCLNNLDKEITICSNDSDFNQLLNDNINIYNPIKNLFFSKNDFIEKNQINPKNVKIIKTFVGDISDNIMGVYGLGEKKIKKMFDLSLKEYTFDDIYDNINNLINNNLLLNKKTPDVYNFLIEKKDYFNKNYKIINLFNPLLNDEKKIKNIFLNKKVLNLKEIDLIFKSINLKYLYKSNNIDYLNLIKVLSFKK